MHLRSKALPALLLATAACSAFPWSPREDRPLVALDGQLLCALHPCPTEPLLSGGDALAALASGALLVRQDARRDLDERIADGLTVPLPSPASDWFAAPHLARAFARLPAPLADEAALVDRGRGDPALEGAARGHDPDLLADALARWPFARGFADAARARGELLLEQGEPFEARLAFQQALGAGRADALGEARSRLELAERLCDELALTPVSQEPREPAACAEASAAEQLWACPEVFPRGTFTWGVLGRQGPGVIVLGAAMDPLCRITNEAPCGDFSLACVVGGRLRWRRHLPVLPWCPTAWPIYLLGLGRIFVVHPEHAIAVDARTGRIEWLRVRTWPAERYLLGDGRIATPLEWPCRRPRGVTAHLSTRELEVVTGTHRERLDPRTGELVETRVP